MQMKRKTKQVKRPGNASLSLGEEAIAMMRYLPRRYVMRDGLVAASASEAVRDLIANAYAALKKKQRK